MGVLWDKPLFANVHVATGVSWRKQIESEMPGAWKTWGRGVDGFRICRVKLGRQRTDDCFKVHGEKVPDFVKRPADANIPDVPRYIDKVLMEISRQGLLGPAGNSRSTKPCK